VYQTPNTTAVTQETDRTYGKFKSQFRKNLELLVDESVKQGKSVAVPQYKHVLLVFGGEDPDTKLELPSAFEVGFSHEACKASWTKVGAAPLTRACLNDPKVRKSIGDGDDEYAQLLWTIQEANDYAVFALSEAGYDGSALQALLKAVPEAQTMTKVTEKRCLRMPIHMVRSFMQLVVVMFALTIFSKQRHFAVMRIP
jgi:hypothetical protein